MRPRVEVLGILEHKKRSTSGEVVGQLKKKLSENLLSAYLHGALLIVAECKSASYEGVNGIMIRDTAETFGIISEDNRFRVVPKAGSVFILKADCWKITLIGNKLSPREKLKEDQRQHRPATEAWQCYRSRLEALTFPSD
ncbi:unnamed protein product [Miscanthus lutarioriparius]|uniref:Uncharacterized protein n=1 Tax=Miscanthus lutarioriparius TaxID=422564 RepID=A0A811RUJ3_9POAL|nr:unnamed protein product [Miscanthus lutarioriparius]